METAIGGYFELADYEEGVFIHQDGELLNTGRNALEYILLNIGNVKCIYLPYYTCEVVLEPLKRLHIPWHFYHINSCFEIIDDIHLKEEEYIIVNNYFGIKDAYIKVLAEKYCNHLIVDCSQALFAKPIRGIKCFYSTRKFVGVADGGIAYLGNLTDSKIMINEIDCTDDHDSHLYIRKQFGAEAGFADYQKNETKLDNQPVRRMSIKTKKILEHIDYEKILLKRRYNFHYLHDALSEINFLNLPELDTFECPMVYPFIINKNINLRKELLNKKIFVAQYWPNVHYMYGFEIEWDLSNKIVPIICDHRYGMNELKRIIQTILLYA